MSFFKKLFGGGDEPSAPAHEPVEHEGFMILPQPIPEGGQFRLGATISKEMDGDVKEHKLIRADMFPSADQCAEYAVTKAKQVIKEQGDRIFR
ncbi:MAG: HlyU family transcriptional regulator [Pseudomonadota bacterium]